MASSSKKKTTMAKHNRENKVREKQMRKAAKKAAKKMEGPDEGDSVTIGAGNDDVSEDVKAAEIAAALQRLDA
jgi:hypothetical protein